MHQYQDYLSSFTGNGPVQPKDFDEWFSDYMTDDSYDMSDMIMDDYDSNVGPMIDKQVNGAIFIFNPKMYFPYILEGFCC